MSSAVGVLRQLPIVSHAHTQPQDHLLFTLCSLLTAVIHNKNISQTTHPQADIHALHEVSLHNSTKRDQTFHDLGTFIAISMIKLIYYSYWLR
jgi:hypothetical protein